MTVIKILFEFFSEKYYLLEQLYYHQSVMRLSKNNHDIFDDKKSSSF